MSKARLIKHREWLEREQAAQRQARPSPVAQVKVDAVSVKLGGIRCKKSY